MEAIIFPYDSFSEPLIRYSELLSDTLVKTLISPAGFGFKSGLDYDKSYIIKNDIMDVEVSSESILLVVESYHKLDFTIIEEQIEKSAQKGLNIMAARSFTNDEYAIIASICKKYDVKFLEIGMEHIFKINEEIVELQDIHTPIVTVLGTGSRCNKLELQLELRKYLLDKGYKVSSVSSKKYCVFSGMHPYPDFMYNGSTKEETKILGYNQYIKYLEELEKPEIIIIGVPGGLMPMSKKKPGNFGVSAYEILNAIKSDFTILSLYKEAYKENYFDEINKLLTYRFNTYADCFNLSNISLDKYAVNSWMPMKYLQHKDSEINIQSRQYKHKVFSRSTYDKLGDFLLETLASYDEVGIL